MQDARFRELSDQELEAVSGGHGHGHFSPAFTSPSFSGPAFTSAGVSVSGSASGGLLGQDVVLTETDSVSVVNPAGESVSVAFGIAIAIAY